MNVENNGQQNRDGKQNDGKNKEASSMVDDDVNLTAYALGEITDPEEANRLKKLLESDSSKRKEFETTIQLASLIRDSVENDLPMAPGSIHDVVLAELDGSATSTSSASSIDQAASEPTTPPANPVAQKTASQKTGAKKSLETDWWKNNKRTITYVSGIAAMILVIVGVLQFQKWASESTNTAFHTEDSSVAKQPSSNQNVDTATDKSDGSREFYEDSQSNFRADTKESSKSESVDGDAMKLDGKSSKKALSLSAGNEAPQSRFNSKDISNDQGGAPNDSVKKIADAIKGRIQSDSSLNRKYVQPGAMQESAQYQTGPGKPDPARAMSSPDSNKSFFKNNSGARGGQKSGGQKSGGQKSGGQKTGGRESGGQNSNSRNAINRRPESTSNSKNGQLGSGPGGGGAAGSSSIAGGGMKSGDASGGSAKGGLGGFGGRGAKGSSFGSGSSPGSGAGATGGSGGGRSGGGVGDKKAPSNSAPNKNSPSRNRSGLPSPNGFGGGFNGNGFGGGGFGGGGGGTAPANKVRQADPGQRTKRKAMSKESINQKASPSIPSVRNEFDRQNGAEKSIRGGGLGQDSKFEYKQQSQSFSNSTKPKKSAGAKAPSSDSSMPRDTQNRLTEKNFESKAKEKASGKGGEEGKGKGTRESNSPTPRYKQNSSKSNRDSDSADKSANVDKTQKFIEKKKKSEFKKLDDSKSDLGKSDEKSEEMADDADRDEAFAPKNSPSEKSGEKQDGEAEAGDSPQVEDANSDFDKKNLIELEKVRRIDPSLENDFVQPIGSDALSSFAIDTDTASYTYVRDMLQKNRLPRPEDVRIEEMVNYFDFKYAQPKENERFSVQMELASSPWSPGNKILKVGLQAKNMDNESRPPSNLVFLVDVSGSMHEPEKLPLLKTALKKLVKQLREDDYVSIVTYAKETHTRLKPTNGLEKDKINAVIDSLEARGGTDASQGLKISYELARQYFRKGGTNRIIMGTDGDFNMGITDTNELTRFIKAKAQSGVYLTICGFGVSNFKDQKMQTAAQNSNGKVYFIDNEDEAERVFVERISGLVTIAKDVKVQLVFNPRTVQSYRLIGYENRVLTAQEFDNHRTDAGEMDAGDSVTALYEIVPGDGKFTFPTTVKANKDEDLKYQSIQPERYELTRLAASEDIAALRIRYKDPNAKLGDKSLEREFVIKNNATNFNRASKEFQLATAVTGLGLMLRGSQHRGTLSFEGLKEFGQSVLVEREPAKKQRKDGGKLDKEEDAVKDSARSVLTRRRMQQRKEVIDLINKAAELYKQQR